MTATESLSYETLVTAPIPIAVADPLPNGERRMWQPVTSTLIHGEQDAVLVDPPFTNEAIERVGDWVASSGKNLTAIVATHGHGDHWFGSGVLAERFGAPVVATAGTIAQMQGSLAARPYAWDKLFPGQIPPSTVTAVTAADNRLTLAGHPLQLVEVGHTDTDDTSVLHVPDLSLVVAGDALYNGAHVFIGESAGAA